MRHFLCVGDCSTEELNELLDLSCSLKKLYKSGGRDVCLAGKVLAMVFEKPSLRTRISFQVAMTDLEKLAAALAVPEDFDEYNSRQTSPSQALTRI